MGRVRRYKKVKAVDPFAKKKKAEIDTIHDEPPSFYQSRVNTAMKQLKKYETNIMAQYRKAAKEIEVVASSTGTSKKASNKPQVETKALEGRREGESLKAFKIRIRQETRKTLHDELKSMTSTAQKRKSRLKERKKKRKTKGDGVYSAGDSYYQQADSDRFGSSEIGAVRNSDRQDGVDSFPSNEQIRFGERVEAPPDLRHTFSMAGAKKAGLGVVHKKRPAEELEGGSEAFGSRQSTAGMRFAQEQNKRARAAAEAGRQQGIVHGGCGTRASVGDIAMARDQAKQAYKALQKKRRAEEGPNFSSIS